MPMFSLAPDIPQEVQRALPGEQHPNEGAGFCIYSPAPGFGAEQIRTTSRRGNIFFWSVVMEQKREKLLKQLQEWKKQAEERFARNADEMIFTSLTEFIDFVNLAIEVLTENQSAGSKPGFTLRRVNGEVITEECECVSIQYVKPVDGGCESFAVSSIHATDFEILSLIKMQDKTQKDLLKRITKKFLDRLDDDSSEGEE